MQEMGITIMLAGNMGMGAFNKLTMHGISVVRGCHGNIEDVLKAYLDGSIADSAESCSHHDCGELMEQRKQSEACSDYAERLMRAMINYNSGDVPRILLEADFLVNSFEANVSKDGIITFRNNVFRSASAIEMLNDMWNL